MYRLLVVDDELYAVRALLKGVDWKELGFEDVLMARDADEAMEIIKADTVDLMICDIEMPGMTGLELAEWAAEQFPWMETVFLTGHADFSYAQQAVQLGSFDYLLKPVRPEQLRQVAVRALEKIKKGQDARSFNVMYNKYVKLWEAQKPILIERFWQDILAGRLAPTEAQLEESLSASNLSITPETRVLPILISVEYWHKELTERDEEIMEYALRNAAQELLLLTPRGDVVKDRNGILFALMYADPDAGGFPDRGALEAACRSYTDACSRFFYCSVSCYAGAPAAIRGLVEMCQRLTELEHYNIRHTGSVQLLDGLPREMPRPSRKKPLQADWSDWAVLLEAGKKEELLKRAELLFEGLQQEQADPEDLSAVYHSMIHVLYQAARKKGMTMKDVAGTPKGIEDPGATRSISHLKAWTLRILRTAADRMLGYEGESSALIEKVKRYIDGSLKEVTRESIAAHVYLNSAYLSRLFKKETGQSLVDYIIQEKMNRAKLLLTETNCKITDICDMLGYENLSYLGRVFKKTVGVTPQEYRKRYQK
ncbi:response regulator transcription factor [Gorillibacterium sp. sgz5001074]|uniref:response regulator transcription factor n=1 Tax=Gorillibacterium sp. sgz5001074 TaxID=3446695 RepID=UPI003F661482